MATPHSPKKMILGAIFLALSLVLIYWFVVSPYALVYQWHWVLQAGIMLAMTVAGAGAIWFFAREDIDPDVDYDLGSPKKVDKPKHTAEDTKTAIQRSLTEIKYHIEKKNIEMGRMMIEDVREMARELTKPEQDELSRVCDDLTGKVEAIKNEIEQVGRV